MDHFFFEKSITHKPARTFFISLGLLLILTWWGVVFSFLKSWAEEVQQLQQIKLTDKLVQGFIAAQKDLEPISRQMIGDAEQQNKTLETQMEQIAIKNGFADLKELQTVGSNISYLLYGLDRKTGAYTEAVDKMKMELEGLKADTSIPEEDKKYSIDALNQDIARAQPLKFKENIEIVKKYQSELDALTFEGEGESLPEDENSTDMLEDQD